MASKLKTITSMCASQTYDNLYASLRAQTVVSEPMLCSFCQPAQPDSPGSDEARRVRLVGRPDIIGRS